MEVGAYTVRRRARRASEDRHVHPHRDHTRLGDRLRHPHHRAAPTCGPRACRAKFRDRAPVIVHDEKMGWDVWKIGEAQSLLTVGHTAVAGWPEPFPSAPRTFAEVPRAAHDAKARLEYMDSIGVWAMALYPNVGGFGNEAFLKLGDPELMLACVQAYNDFQIDWISPDPRRFIPILATPFWDPGRVGARDRAQRGARTPRRAVHGRAAEVRLPGARRSALGSALGRGAGHRAPDQLPHRQRQPHRGVHAGRR